METRVQRKAIRLNIFHVFERFIARPCAYNAWILVCDIWLCLDQGPSYWGGWMDEMPMLSRSDSVCTIASAIPVHQSSKDP